ncbi:MAG: DUF2914 domain-containing protein [Desulfuromonadaceae bacterium]|nr:DUF2914 domain-containing protein [Desulfuromonadaceae bacterium]
MKKTLLLMIGIFLLLTPVLCAAEAGVARALFTTSVENREPVDELTATDTALETLFFFTEINDMAGEPVLHRWVYNGQVMAEVPFTIGGPRWRVYSSKQMIPGWVGKWRVDVVNATGEVVASKEIERSAM